MHLVGHEEIQKSGIDQSLACSNRTTYLLTFLPPSLLFFLPLSSSRSPPPSSTAAEERSWRHCGLPMGPSSKCPWSNQRICCKYLSVHWDKLTPMMENWFEQAFRYKGCHFTSSDVTQLRFRSTNIWGQTCRFKPFICGQGRILKI